MQTTLISALPLKTFTQAQNMDSQTLHWQNCLFPGIAS